MPCRSLSAVRAGQRASRTAAAPDLDGIWNSATRNAARTPAAVGGQTVLSRRKRPRRGNGRPRRTTKSRRRDAPRRGDTGTYSTFFREFGTRIGRRRAAPRLMTDPPDGRIPALTPAAAEVETPAHRVDRRTRRSDRRTLGLQDPLPGVSRRRGRRCCHIPTTATTRSCRRQDAVVDPRRDDPRRAESSIWTAVRICRPRLRRWMGDSVGRWMGATLVVDTTNFNDGGGLYGDAGGNFRLGSESRT